MREHGVQFCLIQDPKQQALPVFELILPPHPDREANSQPHLLLSAAPSLPDHETLQEQLES